MFQGIYMVVASRMISLQSKFLMGLSLLAWLTLPFVSIGNVVVVTFFPLSLGYVLDFLTGFSGAMALFNYGFGYVKQHPVRR